MFKTPLLPDTGADPDSDGGGSQPSEELADSNPDDSSQGQRAADPTPEREEDLEDLLADDPDDDDQDGQADVTTRLKKVLKKHSKTKRQLAKLLPLKKRLEGLDLDDLITSKRQYEALQAEIAKNPRLKRVLFGHGDDDDAEAPTRKPAKKTEPEDDFNEDELPFDVKNGTPIDKYFGAQARELHETRKLVRQLQARLDEAEGRERQSQERAFRNDWMGTISAAAPHIQDEGQRTMFKDLMVAAMRDPETKGRFSPQQIARHYLQLLKVDLTQANRANAAAAKAGGAPNPAAQRQRIAENNKSVPRTVAPTGHPASPAHPRRETLADVARRLRGGSR